jgi:hypothetical protein
MIALFCFLLTLSVSPFKSKSRLEAENGGAPQRVLKTHSSDQVAHLFVDPRSATG